MTTIERTRRDQVPTITPHSGRLIDRTVQGAEADALRHRAEGLRSLQLSARQVSDLDLIGNGAFSPLTGFMRSADYSRVVTEMHLADGLPWSIPVTLAVASDDAPPVGKEVALRDPRGIIRGVMR